jgi:hypothetical protein
MLPTVSTWFERIRRENFADDDLEEARLLFALNNSTQEPASRAGGSRRGRERNIERDFEEWVPAHLQRLFCETPVYSPRLFRRRFRMRRELFLRILNDIREQDPRFEQKTDALGKKGLFPLQKVVAAIQSLRTGAATTC